MKRHQWILILAAALGLYVTALDVGWPTRARSNRESGRVPTFEPIELSGERRLLATDARSSGESTIAATTGHKRRMPSPFDEERKLDAPEADGITVEAIIEQIRQTVDAEPVAPSWQREGAAMISNHIQRLLPPGSAITAIDCRTSWCRFESTHPDERDHQAFFARVLHAEGGFERGPVTTLVTQRQPDGQVIAQNYLGKLDTSLPGIQQAQLEAVSAVP